MQPTFDWTAPDKYHQLNNFEIEVRNIFLLNHYHIQENEKVPIIMNWIGCKGFIFIQTFNDREQEKCKTSSRLFEMLSEKFKY